jgi:protein-tyrosine phosphatase
VQKAEKLKVEKSEKQRLPKLPNCNYLFKTTTNNLAEDAIMLGWFPTPNQEDGCGIDAILDTGRNVFVSLVSDEERKRYIDYTLRVRDKLPFAIFFHHPIVDDNVPTNPQEFRCLIDALAHLVKSGRKIYIHCVGGHGRSAVVAGCLLKTLGFANGDNTEILKRIQEAHAERQNLPDYGSPRTQIQKDYISNFIVS